MPQSSKTHLATMSPSSKKVEELSREEFVEEVTKYRKLISELKCTMECPVCLTIPREGPVPCCPRGHLICTVCLDKMEEAGNRKCPKCRDPMGKGKSLLGKVLIENMEHECKMESCKDMVPFGETEQHNKVCKYRLIICPGNSVRCLAMVSFAEVEKHADNCPGIIRIKKDSGIGNHKKIIRLRFNEAWLESPNDANKPIHRTTMLDMAGEFFFMRSNWDSGFFLLDMAMKGDQEQCNKFIATISILDSRVRPVYTGSFNPRTLGILNAWEDCLSVGTKSLAKVLKGYDGRNFIEVEVGIKLVEDEEDGEDEEDTEDEEGEDDEGDEGDEEDGEDEEDEEDE